MGIVARAELRMTPWCNGLSVLHCPTARERNRATANKGITMTIIKAAAVQISPVLYSREGTTDKVVQKILELGHQGVQFATFPETILP